MFNDIGNCHVFQNSYTHKWPLAFPPVVYENSKSSKHTRRSVSLFATLVSVKWSVTVHLILIPQIMNDVGHIYMYLLASHVFLRVKHLLWSFAWLSGFSIMDLQVTYLFWIQAHCQIHVFQISSPSRWLTFHFLKGVFWARNSFWWNLIYQVFFPFVYSFLHPLINLCLLQGHEDVLCFVLESLFLAFAFKSMIISNFVMVWGRS